MRRRGEELPHRGLLDDLAVVHHRDAVAELSDDAEIVGDQQHAAGVLVDQRPQEAQDLRLDGDVERRGRLVGDEQRRVERQRDGDRDALIHAAAQARADTT